MPSIASPTPPFPSPCSQAAVALRRGSLARMAARAGAVVAVVLPALGLALARPPQPAAPPPPPPGQTYPTNPPAPPTAPPVAVPPRPVPPSVPPDGVQVIVPPARHRPWDGAPVQVQSIAARVTIEEQVGITNLELMLHNPSGRPQECQVLIPVPDGVTVRSFQYDGTGPEPTATLLPREEARRIYSAIVNRAKDPGLLEFAGLNVIRSSVFPVPAGARQAVRITYEQVLPADAGRVDYLLPRSESLAAGTAAWSISVSVKSARTIATAYSPTHEVAVERSGAGALSIRVPDRAATTPGPFRLSLVSGPTTPGDGREFPATIMAYPDPTIPGGKGGGGYFLLLGGVPSAPPAAERMKREVILVIDRSGSMRGPKMEQAKAAAVSVLEGLGEGEAFNIIDFSDSLAMFASAPVLKNPDTIARARGYVGALEANGGTALHDALIESLRQPITPGMLPVVLFMTDGLPTVGERGEAKIRDAAKAANAHNRRVFAFGVGYDVNSPLLSGVARSSRGAATFVLPEENIEIAMSQVFRRLSGPVVAGPRLTAIGADGKPSTTALREVLPAQIPDLFDGDQLIVLAQYTGEGGGALRLRLDGDVLGKPGSFEYAFDLSRASATHGYVPRLWATRKIAALLDEIRQGGAAGGSPDPRSKELIDEVVRLSKQYGILTEYTAFLATEQDGRTAFGGGALPPPSAAPVMAERMVTGRNQARTGAAGVSQELNTQALADNALALKSSAWRGADMKQVEVKTVQMVGQNALYQRENRWVDGRLLADADKEPERVVEFGTPDYDRAVDAMAKEDLLWALTNTGDLYLLLEGKRTLIKQPTP